MRLHCFSDLRSLVRVAAIAVPVIALSVRGDDAKPAAANANATPTIDPAAAVANAAKTGGDVGETMWQTVCAQCHGVKGEGKLEIRSPSIAHLPSWYVTQQISNFREGRRGHDPADPNGLLMAAIAKALQPEQIHAIAKHVEKMPTVATAPVFTETGADLENGMMLFQERCMECHRYNASGEVAFGSPPLTGRQDWYLAEQIRRFKTGKRGTIKGDVNGAKMVLSSQFISDEQSLKDVMAYILSLTPAAIAEEQGDDPFKAQQQKTSEVSADKVSGIENKAASSTTNETAER